MNFNNMLQTEENKSKIIQILILLYANEREIANLFVQGYSINPESKNLKEYFIINKSWIDKFKQIYHYDLVNNIQSMRNITNLKQTFQNMKNYLSLNEIKSLISMINTDISSLSQFNPTLITNSCGENGEYNFPVNFVVIHKSIIKLIQNLIMNFFSDSDYEMQIGISSLFLKSTFDTQKIYVYSYNNNLFNFKGVIEVNHQEIWGGIYNKYLSKITFENYLNTKKIDINKKNQKQKLLNSENKLIGFIYLVSLSGQNDKAIKNITEGEIINNLNIGNNETIPKLGFSPIYHKLIDSINSLETYYPHDLPNIGTIINKISLNELKCLTVYIIQSSKLQYCIDTVKNLKKTYNDFSFCLNNNDLISVENINETTKYSFINSDILKYFKINNTNGLPKFFLFIILKNYTERSMLIYNPKQKNILNIITIMNYMNFYFNN